MATPQQKVDAFNAALDDMHKRAPALAQTMLTDWFNAGFRYTPKVAADVVLVGAINLSDMGAFQAALTDPNAAAIIARDLVGSLTGSVGNSAANAGSAAIAIPGHIIPDVQKGLKSGLDAATGGNASALVTAGQFLSALTNPHTWIRVAEVGIGIALLIVGVIKLTPKSVIQQSASMAKVAAAL